ncbi:ASST-domain-containing protein [Annulohypoxylon truncatum]|uniref:ASST-domain-containing protein n=1 Tax=Annulohypoxylon truncatum TaxID=327061 RepID=UPI00200746E7|nr:ASST-domain-containing protein [Annulohypoxylon truncatum]KAI1208223.1 ASST-domain-containing protein [Annulohypoxylon truncatum]
MKLFFIGVTLMFPSIILADWQFKSRSDLAPPNLNITIPATKDVEKGYLFVAPFAGFPDTPTEQHGPRQAGPYIFRDNGDLVWSGYGIYSIWSTNFQAGRWRGKDILFSFEGDHNPGYGHGHGHITIMDNHYETIRELRAGNHKLVDKHEFHIINEETGLIQIYQPVARDLTAWGGSSEQQWVVNSIIQELDIATGKLLFEWASLDYVSPDEAILPINPGQAGSGFNSSDAWDYFHINSVDKDADGNYLISARDACSIHKINGTDGSIIWKLDGKDSSFKMPQEAKFCFQHHARFISQEDDIEIISLYDNSAHGTEHGGGSEVHTAPTSSGKIIKVNTTSWEAELVQAFFPPDDLLSKSQGSTQTLPNGNALVNWGSSGAVTEYLPDGTPIFHAYMDSDYLGLGVENYRAFRYNWTGLPNEDPAIVALKGEEGLTAYVSWNGDTETKVWRFYALTDEYGSKEFLGEAERISFETSLHIQNVNIGAISAEAIDGNGKLLRSTGITSVEQEIKPEGKPTQTPILKTTAEKTLVKPKSHWEEYGILKYFRFPINEL